MPSRFEFERAIRRSGLPPLSRLLALTIATWADLKTGKIPAEHQPAQSVLLEATGLSKVGFLTHRARLVEDGWLTYTSPTPDKARREHAQNAYFIHIPARSLSDLAPKKARSPSDPAKTGKAEQKPQGARSPSDLELGRPATQGLGRPATTRVTTPSTSSSVQPAQPQPVTAQTIVGEWLDRASKRPPGSVIGQVGKHVAALLEEHIDPDDVRRGLAHWMTKGLHPSVIPSVVNEVMNAAPPRQPNGTRYSDPSERGTF